MLATREQLAHIAIQAELLAVEARAAILTTEDADELFRMVSECLRFLATPGEQTSEGEFRPRMDALSVRMRAAHQRLLTNQDKKE